MTNHEADFYQKLRSRIREWLRSEEGASHPWVEYLMWAPDLFHLLCRLSVDDDIPLKEKAKLAGAVAYFISPIDLIPEILLGPVGFVDDIVLGAYVLNSLLNSVGPEVLKRHWAGEEDVLRVIQSVLGVAHRLVGARVWEKLKEKIS